MRQFFLSPALHHRNPKLAAGVIAVSLVIAGSGGFLLYKASRLSIDDRQFDLDQPRHLVTKQMEIESFAMSKRKEPTFQVSSELGAPIHIALPDAERPQFVYFIKRDCPCSIDAQPLFNRLSERFKGKVDFVGVIDGDRTEAKSFASLYSAAFPVVPDQKQQIIRGFEAKGGIYCALLAKNGHLIKMWPGYSADLLREMNHYLAAAAAVPETPFDPQYAPKQKAAGCAYTGVNW